jgi:hypothetical protein
MFFPSVIYRHATEVFGGTFSLQIYGARTALFLTMTIGTFIVFGLILS